MTRMTAMAAAVMAAAACGGSQPPADRPAPQGPGGIVQLERVGGAIPSVYALIGAREQMGLTGAQVTGLDSIGRAWSVRNDSLTRQLREAEGGNGRGIVNLERARPTLEQMAANNQGAAAIVHNLLTPEQRAIACTLTAGQDRPARRPPARRPSPGARPGGVRLDSIPTMRRGWPWCRDFVADSARSGAAARSP